MRKKIAILQSNYIPWKGYFDLIAAVDEFVIFDDMQYTRRDWRNRNQIKTPQGLQWITVPVQVKGRYYQSIRDTRISGSDWSMEHWKALEMNYRRAPYFDDIANWLEPLYLEEQHFFLSQLNCRLIQVICDYLGITTSISCSWDYDLIPGKTERLVSLCVQAGADEYVSGPSAQNYIDEGSFAAQNIRLTWFDYSGYSQYSQLWGEFAHEVTILDLLFNCGRDASKYMRYVDR